MVWSYFAEFQPKNRRGGMLSALATFWMIGNIAVAGNLFNSFTEINLICFSNAALAWLIIPMTFEYNLLDGEFKFNSWRLFVALCGVPALLGAILLL